MRSVLLVIAHDLDRLNIKGRLSNSYVVRSMASPALLRDIRLPAPFALVYEPGLGQSGIEQVGRCLETWGSRLIIRTCLDPCAVTELLSLAPMHPALGVSIRWPRIRAEVDDLVDALGEPDCGPAGYILTRAQGTVGLASMPYVIAAISLGKTRVTAKSYASTLGQAMRTAQMSHKRFALPPPHRLLAWTQTIWTAWRLQRWGMGYKQAARAGRFATLSSMTDLVTHTAGASPRQLTAAGGVQSLIERFVQELESRTCHSTTAA
jgi:hypothetical protein